MKISTSTPLARFKSGWIDFDAGPIIEGEKMDDMLQRLIAKVLETANGDRVKHEQVGFKELAIFKSGVTL